MTEEEKDKLMRILNEEHHCTCTIVNLFGTCEGCTYNKAAAKIKAKVIKEIFNGEGKECQ